MSRAYVRRIVLGGVTLATIAATATAHGGGVGAITYTIGSTAFVAGDGSVLAAGVDGNGVWSPDGSRFAFASTDGTIKTVRHNGGPALTLTNRDRGVAIDPTWSAHGQRVYFSRGGRLWQTSSDGSYPSVSDAGEVIFERSDAIYRYNPGNPANVTKLIDVSASPDEDPVWSPMGRVVYFSRDGRIHVASADGPGFEESLEENPDPALIQDTLPTVSMTGRATATTTTSCSSCAGRTAARRRSTASCRWTRARRC